MHSHDNVGKSATPTGQRHRHRNDVRTGHVPRPELVEPFWTFAHRTHKRSSLYYVMLRVCGRSGTLRQRQRNYYAWPGVGEWLLIFVRYYAHTSERARSSETKTTHNRSMCDRVYILTTLRTHAYIIAIYRIRR